MKRMTWLAAIVTFSVSVTLAGSARAQSGKIIISQTPMSSEASASQTSGGYLGVFLADVNEQRGKELKLAEVRGALVGKVREGSPAEKAGLRENDVILSYNGQPVESKAVVNRLLSETPPGRSVTLGISRAGERQNLEVTLGDRRSVTAFGLPTRIPTDADLMKELAEDLLKQSEQMSRQLEEKKAQELLKQSEALRKQAEDLAADDMERLRREGKVQSFDSKPRLFNTPSATRYHLGASVAPLSDQLAKFFNVKGGAGLLVTEVEPKSAAERAGLKAGDCITTVNGERVNSSADLTRLISRPGKDGPEAAESSLTVVRDRSEQTIKVKPERR